MPPTFLYMSKSGIWSDFIKTIILTACGLVFQVNAQKQEFVKVFSRIFR